MCHVSVRLFQLELCACGYLGNARTVTGSHSEQGLNSLRLTCCSLRHGEVSLTVGCLFTQ